MKTKTLYASDLDGTLLDPGAKLTPHAAALLREVTDAGGMFTFITARTPATIEPIMAAAPPRIPGVCMTGAALWDCASRRYDRVRYMSPDDVAAVSDICLRMGIQPYIYTLEPGAVTIHVYRADGNISQLDHSFVLEREHPALKNFHIGSRLPAGLATQVVLFFAFGAHERIRNAALEISDNTTCQASWYPDTYHPGISLLEIFTHGVSKASGLRELREITRAERVMVFGDNLNDIPMMREADIAVAVDNANINVRDEAHIIIGPSYHDSVAQFIHDDFFSPE